MFMMNDKIKNVLFICTHNSARSIIAEAILNKIGKNKFVAFSAGSSPKSMINPNTIKFLKSQGYETDYLRSKNWNEFANLNSPKIEFIFTVCHSAAKEACPIWPGHSISTNWGVEDPSSIGGTEKEVMNAYLNCYEILKNKIVRFVNLRLEEFDQTRLKNKLIEINKIN